ncbi:MAG TPA: isopenicillin N synthase family oxygenase, partial [Rhizobiales bacterium]|nr:isopenicillin N synthase family oxygenase [Hyphomicrobiales bacterium]
KMSDSARPDLKESFIWGYQDEQGAVPKDHSLRGDNQWPDFLPQLQNHAMTYFGQAHGVAHHLMRGFALGLGLEENYFLKTCSRPLSRASFVYYPPQPENLGQQQFGVGEHTDFGVLTVLCQDDVGGLQVKNVDGQWIEAPPVPGSLIVNVGDLLSRWTDGAYKSTPHRVVNSSGRERLSLVLAFDPDPQTIIDAREIYGAEYNVDNEPITCGDYLTWRFDKAFAYRKN